MLPDFRYRRLGYLTLQVSDIERSTRFLTDVFGLDLGGAAPGGGRFFRCGPHHHDILLLPAGRPAFVRAAWELETDADLERAFAHFRRLGREPAWLDDAEASDLRLERAFRMTEPVLRTSHDYFAKMSWLSTPTTNRLTGFQGGKHYGLAVPDPKALNDHMVDEMGFLVSDYLEGWLGSLLRAHPNPNHHSFGSLPGFGGNTGFHHVAFMVDTIDDIGRLMNRARRHDVAAHFGVGRHPTSGSIHFYVYDPDNFVWEYTLGMGQFPETGAREARRMSARPEDFDLWGAVPDGSRDALRPPYLTF